MRPPRSRSVVIRTVTVASLALGVIYSGLGATSASAAVITVNCDQTSLGTHHQDVRLRDLPRVDAVDQALADQLADLHVVEADVVVAAAAQREAVVVDDVDAVRLRVVLDTGADTLVERVDDEHLGTVGDGGLAMVSMVASLPWAFWM